MEAYTKGHFPDLSESDVVLIGVPEFSGTQTTGNEDSLTKIREAYYQLYRGSERLRIADLGNLLLGEKIPIPSFYYQKYWKSVIEEDCLQC